MDNGHKTPYPKKKSQSVCSGRSENNYQVSVKLQVRFWGISCVIYEYTGPKVGQKMSDVSLEIQTLLTKC